MRLDCTRDASEFDRWLAEVDVDDVYARLGYAALWAAADGARPLGLRGRDASGEVLYPLLEVPLDALPGGAGRCDLRTAYDFGGPLVVGPEPAIALKAFDAALADLARELGAVSEFARLHPLRPGPVRDGAIEHARNLVVDLRPDPAALRESRPSAFRRGLRRAQREGVEARVVAEPDALSIHRFVELYDQTMERVGASADYRFDASLLEALLALPEMSLVEARRADEVLASACFLRSAEDWFYFLGASRTEGLELRPNHALFDAAVVHGCASGLRRLHLGAGSESLRRFKAQLATGEVPYRLTRRVHDPLAYQELCRAARVKPDSAAFPAYRERLRSAQ